MGPLRSMLAKGLSLSFEEPISFCEKNINIYGYVDLVARDGSNVFIVDFKSSEVSMNSYSTKIQLLLYAKFFLKNFNGNVFMSSCMIGSDKDLKWIPVNRVFL